MEEKDILANKKYLLEKKEGYSFDDLVLVLELLRAPGGCPWDREQTHKSIRNNLIEETYEVIEAIDTENPVLLREELGDVLMQVVFHAQLERETGTFDMSGVTNDVCAKLIHRHPHVFGNVIAETSEQVLSNWDAIKSEEKHRETVTDKLRAIPPMFPALLRAAKVGKKAKGMDFPDTDSVMTKLEEETNEVREAIAERNPDHVEEEIGDLLFTAAQLSRKAGVEPEEALYHATEKFITRFAAVEAAVSAEGREMADLSASELDEIWEKVKKNA